ncbi:PEGA domain-containing protein [Myxococcus landrumensis]|uniref:PEGA domain-containing protein n=1 Tax=Myxococcus landrumensis TaxID=2813577 RepID=A0ABX7MXP4_9BACT|nr:PEGA domain-containing protein [Myxococcus landrumus]QSQ11118.1 PEGA domain-containing protein [Myxococcus landrumus]
MRIPAVLPVAMLALVLLARPSWAQEQGGLGLDLSSDTSSQTSSPQEQAVGLDLREGDGNTVSLTPRYILLGLETPERAGAQQASVWLRELARGAVSSGMVVFGGNLREVRERLEAGYDAALRCTQAACMSGPAEALDADLMTAARLSLEDAGWTLRMWTYDRDKNVVHEDAVSGRNPKDAAFQKEAAAKLGNRVMGLARPRALLKVTVNVPTAVVKVGERILGVGSVEARVAPGTVQVEVSAEEYATFTKTVALKPGGREEVVVRMEISGPAPEGPDEAVARAMSTREGGTPIYKRPALYTALVGLAAVGVGLVMGKGAKDVEKRATDADGDGMMDITRKERLDAQSKANLATALLIGGGVATAGSVTWLLVVPARSEAPASANPASSGASSMALHVVVGGSF